MNRAELALAHAVLAPVAGLGIHSGHVLAPEHDLEVAAGMADAVRYAVLIAVAQRTDIRSLERSYGMDEALLGEIERGLHSGNAAADDHHGPHRVLGSGIK